MDNMPDFDSMTPEEMMAWMETLAKRQGATEGLVTAGDMDVPEIDPNSVGDIDEPGYIPFGMDPDVWAQKKAKEDAERAERIAALRSEKEKPDVSTGFDAPLELFEDEPAASNPLDFLADMSGVSEAPDLPVFSAAPEITPEPPVSAAYEAPAVPEASLDDLFADLSGAVVPEGDAQLDWLADLGQSAGSSVPDFDNLDFGSLEALDSPVGDGDSNPLEWLESLVSNGDSDRVETISEPARSSLADDDMLLAGEDILEDSAVSAVLNDSMDWLADFADTQPMSDMASQAASSREVLEISDDLDDFFDRINSDERVIADETPGFDLNQPMGAIAESGMIDFGAPNFEADEAENLDVGQALTQGSEIQPEDVRAWMDSMLDHGIQRTDVTDEDDELGGEIKAELPDWLVEQAGNLPSDEALQAASEGDLPDWLTAPVSDSDNAAFEAMFSAAEQESVAADDLELPELEGDVAPLDTGVIRVQMDDPWVEAFELERDERLSDTGRLAAWYESAAHEVQAAQRQYEEDAALSTSEEAAANVVALSSAELPVDEELPHGEPQSVPSWLGEEVVAEAPVAVSDGLDDPTPSHDEELPDWLRAAQLESDEMAEVPAWLSESLSTDEFEILQLGTAEASDDSASAAIQDEPTTPLPVQPSPLSQLPPMEARIKRQPREQVAAHEVANIINQARASHKLGDINAMLEGYERLIRSEHALEDIEGDMEKVVKHPVHKTNPAALRVYGDVLLRRGKLQQALDTYRAALNLL